MTRPFCALVLGLLLFGGSVGVARAGFIDVPPPGSNYELVNAGTGGATPATVSYDAATDVLQANASFGPVTAPGSLISVSPFAILANDIVGAFSLTADISNAGVVTGGTVTLKAGSSKMGISSNTTLFTGTVVSQAESSGILQIVADLTSVNSQLTSTVGDVDSVVMDFITGNVSYGSSFSMTTASESPDIFLVPEPGTLAVFAVGCLLLGLFMRSRRRQA